MKLRRFFGLYNLIIVLVPLLFTGVVSVAFALIFVLRFPVEELYITRADLINPATLFSVMGKFFDSHPLAIGYIALWALLCIALTALTTTIVTKRMALIFEGSLNRLTKAAEKLRHGDLSFEIMGNECEEIDALCTAFENMRCELLRARAKEEYMNKERAMLIANISHDLKTPITAIRGYADAINDGIANTPEKMSEYLGVIKAKTTTIENLVSNLSMYSRLELSALEFSFELGEMNDLMYEICADYREPLIRYGISLLTDFCDYDTTVNIDFEKLRRVFINIFENAIKYRRPESSAIYVKTECESGGVFVHIKDDGIGLSADELEKVFDSFYRADSARTSNIKGNGLGLGIAKQITEKHKGKIWLKSDGKGKGTTVTVYIPLYKKERI